VNNTLDISTRRNLAQISKVITQITTGSEFGGEGEGQNYIAINEYVRAAIKRVGPWVLEGAYRATTPVATA
jgi:Ras GTPase-activating-like protein IQGAP2/3